MVLNIGLLKSGQTSDYEAVRQDIRGVVELAHAQGAIVKVILETYLLSFEEKLRAAEIALSAGADFLKTSTGFSTGGATTDDITLLRGVAGTRAGVKASGGIRSLADAIAMLASRGLPHWRQRQRQDRRRTRRPPHNPSASAPVTSPAGTIRLPIFRSLTAKVRLVEALDTWQ